MLAIVLYMDSLYNVQLMLKLKRDIFQNHKTLWSRYMRSIK